MSTIPLTFIPEAWFTDRELPTSSTAPPDLKIRMDYAGLQHRRSGQSGITQQSGLGKDFYFCYLEFRLEAPLTLMVDFSRGSLYQLMVLEGHLRFPHPNGLNDIVAKAKESHMSYEPAGKLETMLPKGLTRMLYFTEDAYWLQLMEGGMPALHEAIGQLKQAGTTRVILPVCLTDIKMALLFRNLVNARGRVVTDAGLQMDVMKLLKNLFLAFNEQLMEGNVSQWQHKARLVARFSKHLDTYLGNGVLQKVGDIASLLNVTAQELNRACKLILGQPPKKIILETGLQLAKQWMSEEQLPAGHAAYMLGYERYSSFIREYEKYHGHTPSGQQLKR